MYKLVFYVPIDEAEIVKDAVFNAGAGTIGNYKQCSFEVKGIGQFMPLEGSNPKIGEIHQLEKVEELRVEMLCNPSKIHEVLKALKRSHPYEEVAYEVYNLESF